MRSVFIKFEPGDAGGRRVTMRSWETRGWKVRIWLGQPLIGKHFVVGPRDVNYSFKRGVRRIVNFGKQGWKTAAIVRFPMTMTEDQILNCRSL